jgi:YVTN family beta-propeller protein
MAAMDHARSKLALLAIGALGTGLMGCADDSDSDVAVSQHELENRAYVVSAESGELTVFGLDKLEIVGRVNTGGASSHMAELNADFSKVYVSASEENEVVVVNAVTLDVIKRIPVGVHNTHLSMSRDGKLLAVMDEDESGGAVSFIDTERDVEIKRLGGFYTPHFMRFARDGRYGYVANVNAHHITRVDLEKLEIDEQIPLDGFAADVAVEAPGEGGFADVQIDADGILYAAHASTGRVLVYDTERHEKLPELQVGARPWMVYAEHPFPEVTARVVPNFEDESVSVITGKSPSVTGVVSAADKESFGVNYSPLTPNRAFVMNRFREEIAVVNTDDMQAVTTIDVGGNTETAATTPDGKMIIASVSGRNAIVMIDPVSATIIKTFEDIGRYPWSVTVPLGQNYCH